MPEILTESFCERCGTRYTFESGAPKARLKGLKVMSRGLRNFVMSDDTSIDEAMAAARSETDREVTAQQLDAFHKTFNFCMTCRQYTCGNCWNEAEGRCLTCAPHLGHEIMPAPFPDLDPTVGECPTQLVWRPFRDHTSAIDHDHPIGDGSRLVHEMRGDQHTGSVVETPPNHVPEPPPCLHIEPLGGLVQHQQHRIGNQPHRQLQPLLLSARELGRATCLQPGQAHLRNGPRGCLRGTTPTDGGPTDDLAHGEGPRETDRLLDDTEPASGLGTTRVAACHLDEVGVALDQADHIANEGCLTGPIWTEKCDTLPRLDSQIHAGERRVVTVSVNEAPHFEHMFHLLPPSTPIMRDDR